MLLTLRRCSGRLLSLAGAIAALSASVPSSAKGDVLFAWGNNSHGELGDGTMTVRRTPTLITAFSGSGILVAPGREHGLAFQGGAASAWGDNGRGQLGDGTRTRRLMPAPIAGFASGVTAMSGGDAHTLVVQNGRAYAWGFNSDGQVGNGAFITDQLSPVPVTGMTSGVSAISAGGNHSLAIKDGQLFAWGNGGAGQMGNGTLTQTNTLPIAVPGMTGGVTAISGGANHSLAIRNGQIYSWGSNSHLQIGDGTSDQFRLAPTAIAGVPLGATAVAAGAFHSLALHNGQVYSWGQNGGALGDGNTSSSGSANRSTPYLIPSLSNIVQIAAGDAASYALASDGTLWVWGHNELGQLGLGDIVNRYVPTQLLPPSGYVFDSIMVSQGSRSAYATAHVIPAPSALGVVGCVGLFAARRRRAPLP